MERSRVRAKRSYWRRIGEAVPQRLSELVADMDALKQGEAFFTKFAIEHDIDFETEGTPIAEGAARLRNRLHQAIKRVTELNSDNEMLKDRGVQIILDEDTRHSLDSKSSMRTSRETGLIGKLNDLYASNPDRERTRNVVERLLKSSKTRDATKNLLQGFLDGLDRPNEEEAAIGADLVAGIADLENRPSPKPSNLEAELADAWGEVEPELGAHPLVDLAEPLKARPTKASGLPPYLAEPTSARKTVESPASASSPAFAPKKRSWRNGWGLW